MKSSKMAFVSPLTALVQTKTLPATCPRPVRITRRMCTASPAPVANPVITSNTAPPPLLHTVVVRNGAEALSWYEKALNAKTVDRYEDENGRIMHAILESEYGIKIAVEDFYPEMHLVKPVAEGETAQGAPASGCTYTYITIPKGKGTADEAIERMRQQGAKVVKECEDLFYGHRMGQVVDIYGGAWAIAHALDS